MRTRFEKTELPLEAYAAIFHHNAQFPRRLRHRDHGRLRAGVLDGIAKKLPDHLEYQYPKIEIDGCIIRRDMQIDAKIVLAAHVDNEPLERRPQSKFVQTRGAQVRNNPLR